MRPTPNNPDSPIDLSSFNLRSWTSGSPAHWEKAIVTKAGVADTTPQTGINILGLRWITSTDIIQLGTKKNLTHIIRDSHETRNSTTALKHIRPHRCISSRDRAKNLMQQQWQQSWIGTNLSTNNFIKHGSSWLKISMRPNKPLFYVATYHFL